MRCGVPSSAKRGSGNRRDLTRIWNSSPASRAVPRPLDSHACRRSAREKDRQRRCGRDAAAERDGDADHEERARRGAERRSDGIGKAAIAVAVQGPDGLRKPVHGSEQYFEGAERGANLIIQMNFTFKIEGLYWFEIYVNDQPMTRVPLRVMYSRVTRTLPPP